jgi:hypothetical protein
MDFLMLSYAMFRKPAVGREPRPKALTTCYGQSSLLYVGFETEDLGMQGMQDRSRLSDVATIVEM